MTDAVTAAQAELRDASRTLQQLRLRLLGVIAILPPDSTDGTEQDSTLDMASEMRRTATCVLDDCIRPAIADLSDAAAYRPAAAGTAEAAEDR
ncbi:MAG TPA: hypothetical protein VHQ90_06405 [Thermoanaerobaculia bacterium]|nr:hypothetical protein [Thermoanaerobaculia bacterium]